MGKHVDAVTQSTLKAESSGEGWGLNHARAMSTKYARSDFELAIGGMVKNLALYADAHAKEYESSLGDDYVLGPEWAAMVRGLIGLLNGETGRLDCGTLDAVLRGMLNREGLEEEG